MSSFTTLKLTRPIPQPFADLFTLLEGEDATFAGGFVRWLASPRLFPAPFGDVDILCLTEDSYVHVFNVLTTTFRLDVEKETKTATTFKGFGHPPAMLLGHGQGRFELEVPKIQIVRPGRFPGETFEEAISTFDLTICQAALIDKDHAIVHPDFVNHEMEGLIVIGSFHNMADIFNRIAKYSRKGYHFQPSEGYRILRAWDALDHEIKAELMTRFEEGIY